MSGKSAIPIESTLGSRLADWLAASEQEIVWAWGGAVRADSRIHSDDSLSYQEFVDHIPKVVSEVCNLLRGSSLREEQPAIHHEGRVHGIFRWRQGYDLAELLREIGHLRIVLVDFLARGAEELGLEPRAWRAVAAEVLRSLDESQLATVLTYVVERDRELAERERDARERDRRLQQHLLEADRARIEALESAATAKDEFLGTLSHELRTPLTPILAWVAILEKDVSPATVAAAVRTIGRNARVLLQLIDDLLDVSKVVVGKLEIARDRLDTRQVARAARDLALPAATAKNVSIRLEQRAESLPVIGDGPRLRQAVGNLVSNAVKFSPSGGEIVIETRAEGAEAVISVTDRGEGIDPAFLPHIFERFRQQDQGFTRGHGGLGLGLAIARAVSDAHGGRLTARSPGRQEGSTFELRLPLAPAQPAATDAEEALSAGGRFLDASGPAPDP